MGPDDGAVSVRAHHAGDGVHMDDGLDGLYPLFGALVLACQRDYARQLTLGLHPYGGLCRQHDFVERPVLLDKHSVRLLAGVARRQDRPTGHSSLGSRYGPSHTALSGAEGDHWIMFSAKPPLPEPSIQARIMKHSSRSHHGGFIF